MIKTIISILIVSFISINFFFDRRSYADECEFIIEKSKKKEQILVKNRPLNPMEQELENKLTKELSVFPEKKSQKLLKKYVVELQRIAIITLL